MILLWKVFFAQIPDEPLTSKTAGTGAFNSHYPPPDARPNPGDLKAKRENDPF